MNEKFLRIYKKFHIDEVKTHLMIYGDLSGACANCNNISVKLSDLNCSGCKTEFKYIAFRNIKSHLPKMQKIFSDRPSVLMIDYDDFKQAAGQNKAQEFFK